MSRWMWFSIVGAVMISVGLLWFAAFVVLVVVNVLAEGG